MRVFLRKTLICLFLCFLSLLGKSAETQCIKEKNVTLNFVITDNQEIILKSIQNANKNRIALEIDGILFTNDNGDPNYIDKQSSISFDEKKTPKPKRSVKILSGNIKTDAQRTTLLNVKEVLSKYQPVKPEPELASVPVKEEVKAIEPQKEEIKEPVTKPLSEKPVSEANKPSKTKEEKKKQKTEEIVLVKPIAIEETNYGIDKWLANDNFWSVPAVNLFLDESFRYAENLKLAPEKGKFITDHNLRQYVENAETQLNNKRDSISIIVSDYILSDKVTSADKELKATSIALLEARLNARQESLNNLKAVIDSVHEESEDHTIGTWLNIVLILLVIAIIAFIAMRMYAKRQSNNSQKGSNYHPNAPQTTITQEDAEANIVVRRRTTSILKKQNIDDVINNPEYFKIQASDFSTDSTIRNIYIKADCIKDVYDLYSEDLRNPDKPKEDGCMVLGRWVRDEQNQTYDVTLEQVVLPGDDAIFKEYELNFGGKIKLRVAEKLRKLRRDTNLQYDLTCWIHSHPGLGVFFSNSDSSVQMQLKHIQHPNFLTAFVVDILTENQEFGIFTFRQDGTILSKQDLKKMYSLEELYQWAVQSRKKLNNAEALYPLLANAPKRSNECQNIKLNNNAIIDLAQSTTESENTGIVGWAEGYDIETENGTEFFVTSILNPSQKSSTEAIGCLLNLPHTSIPTIQRYISNQLNNLHFVIVYSTRQMTLTAIPVVNGMLCTDERYFGEDTLDNLKIWTRRKR